MAEIVEIKLITLVEFKDSEPLHAIVEYAGGRHQIVWPDKRQMMDFIDATHDTDFDIMVASLLKEARTEDIDLGVKTRNLKMIQFRVKNTITRLP